MRVMRSLPRSAVLPSLRASLGFGVGSLRDLPIVAGPGSRITAAESSQLDLGGQLFLGVAPDRVTEEDPQAIPAIGSSILCLSSKARFATSGWIVVGPGCHISVGTQAAVEFGEGSYITANARILANERISIGAACAISWDVLIMDHDAHWLEIAGVPRRSVAPITIEDHVWIGAKATILKGVTLGKGSVVGAGSVVTKDVPPGAVAAGVPAAVVAEGAEWW